MTVPKGEFPINMAAAAATYMTKFGSNPEINIPCIDMEVVGRRCRDYVNGRLCVCRSQLWGKDPLVVKTRVSRQEWSVDPGSLDHKAGAGHRVRGGRGSVSESVCWAIPLSKQSPAPYLHYD